MKKLLLVLAILFFGSISSSYAACPATSAQFKDNAGSTFNMALTSDANGNCVAKADWDTNSQAHTDITAPIPCKGFTTSTTQTPVSSGTATPAGCDLNGNLYVNAAITQLPGTTYNTVAASQTTQSLTGGSGGATGDLLNFCMVIPTSTSPGVVTILDNATTVAAFPGGASSISNLVPFVLSVGSKSVSGAWKVTTGANLSVVCNGKFT